ncbi:hypothetical protein DID80_06860 [Candidatus Marinamargulisbacteria bacterium SCGC AAA071-K20]|nr:hypothetical protein DID80_06860 [Candidatus Marinamargulisbacteria bacterium SCGC AAA071-K20]
MINPIISTPVSTPTHQKRPKKLVDYLPAFQAAESANSLCLKSTRTASDENGRHGVRNLSRTNCEDYSKTLKTKKSDATSRIARKFCQVWYF